MDRHVAVGKHQEELAIAPQIAPVKPFRLSGPREKEGALGVRSIQEWTRAKTVEEERA